MKTTQVSHLPEVTTVSNNDLIMISQKQLDGTYISKKANASVVSGTHVTNVTTNYNANLYDTFLSCNASNNINITLYQTISSGKSITIKNIGQNRVFVLPYGNDGIGGAEKIVINETHAITIADLNTGNWSLIYNDT